MNSRENQLKKLNEGIIWDIVIIGGGATGLGCAIDAASRGYKTLLLEQADFAKGTSSRSTKLVHGGVRYLAQGDVKLVFEALYERGLLFENASHLVKKQSFIIPCFNWFSKVKYLVGLKIYDWMAGKYSFGSSIYMKAGEVLSSLPGLSANKLAGGIEYYDGQFDDARLAINMAQTAVEQGGVLLNYVKVSGLIKDLDKKVVGLEAIDIETGVQYTVKAKSVINATGVFVDDVLQMDEPASKPLVRPSQGVHVVLDRTFMDGESALMIPETSDGRVLFVVPWHGHLLMGTTDTLLNNNSLEPIALQEEIDFILKTAGDYLKKVPTKADVLSVFAGLRPLAAPDKSTNKTKEISRSHKLIVSESGLVTITGGKWTTYRRMAQDTIDLAITSGKLANSKCVTSKLKIHGYSTLKCGSHLDVYGADANHIRSLISENPAFEEILHPLFPNIAAEVVWATRNEMARTVEDILARRLRVLFLNAKAAIEMAPKVASLMATELGYGKDWEKEQVDTFVAIARGYILDL